MVHCVEQKNSSMLVNRQSVIFAFTDRLLILQHITMIDFKNYELR